MKHSLQTVCYLFDNNPLFKTAMIGKIRFCPNIKKLTNKKAIKLEDKNVDGIEKIAWKDAVMYLWKCSPDWPILSVICQLTPLSHDLNICLALARWGSSYSRFSSHTHQVITLFVLPPTRYISYIICYIATHI